jgi:hypothetical protein
MTVIEIEPVDYYCPHCDSAMEWTACRAPYCRGYRCLGCGAGCDLYAAGEDGACAVALATLPPSLAAEMREERRLSYRHGRPVRTVRLPGECA